MLIVLCKYYFDFEWYYFVLLYRLLWLHIYTGITFGCADLRLFRSWSPTSSGSDSTPSSPEPITSWEEAESRLSSSSLSESRGGVAEVILTAARSGEDRANDTCLTDINYMHINTPILISLDDDDDDNLISIQLIYKYFDKSMANQYQLGEKKHRIY